MKQCERIWEVEAARDGRLSGADLARVERHVAGCAECIRERERLEELALQLRALPVSEVAELAALRQRRALLSRAFALAEAGTHPTRLRLWRPAAIAALALSVWVYLRHQDTRSDLQSALTIEASPDSRYTRETTPRRELIQLRDGKITIRVPVRAQRRQVLVRTPDGEIEDVGTVFSVSVEHARTRSITVSEGRVVARLAGHEAHWVLAGQSYYPSQEPSDKRPAGYASLPASPTQAPTSAAPVQVTAGASPANTPLATARAAQPLGAARAAQPRAHAGGTSAKSTVAVVAGADPPAGVARDADAVRLFKEALARVEARDETRAAELLAQFIQRYPEDRRAEDAAFLRTVVMKRAGDLSGARSAARAYLVRFPHGFRASDVQRLLESLGPAPD